jgi:glutaminase
MPDRWGGYPISDAIEGEHIEVVELFKKRGITGDPPNHLVYNTNESKDYAAEYNNDLAIVELLWAAAENNIAGLRRLVAQGVPVHAPDYDQRTALHLASAEGHLEAIKYLIAHGHPLNVRDRWLATPLDEAIREGRTEVVNYLSQLSESQ